MTINGVKTKTMSVSIGAETDYDQPAITLKDNAMEGVKAFSYIRIWGVRWGKLLG